VLTAPANTTIEYHGTENLQTLYDNWLASVVKGGGCELNVTNDAPLAPPTQCNGSYTVTWSATSRCESKSVSATFTVLDKNKPVAIAQNVIVQLDITGNGSTTAALVNNGSSDACGIATLALSKTAFTCSDISTNPNLVTLTVTDKNGNVSTAIANVTVKDEVKPVITCKAGSPFSRYVDPYQTYYTVSGTEFDAIATDACGIASLTYKINGGAASTVSTMAGVQLNLGTNTIVWTAVDVNSNSSTCTTIVNVAKRGTTLTYNGAITVQYSDVVNLSAKLVDMVSGSGVSGKTISFKIGTQSATGITDAVGVAIATLTITQAPGNYTVKSDFIGDGSYLASSDLDNFTITKENANVTYTGMPYFSTASSSSTVANITLSATIKDISALGGSDTYAGDIRNATVTFRRGSVTGSILGAANIPVVLVSSGITMVGTASTSFNYTLSNTEVTTMGTTLEVYAVVNNYYTGDNNLDPGSVTVTIPGSESVNGGGFLVMQNSMGTYAGTVGTKTNFGFTMKWTKSGTNPKGQANIIIRRNGRVYQIKSNAINSLSVNGSLANFSTKANMKDITDPLNPISIGGNADLFVNAFDANTGGQLDEISILYQSGSSIIYSSHWNGTQTIRRLLDGGNISVKKGTTKELEASEPVIVEKTPQRFNLNVYPNPTADPVNFKFTLEESSKVTLEIFNSIGAMVERVFEGDVEKGIEKLVVFNRQLPEGVYLYRLTYGGHVKTGKFIKTVTD